MTRLGLIAPAKHQTGRNPIAPRHRSHCHTRCKTLLDNPRLVLKRPAPPPFHPSQNLRANHPDDLKYDLKVTFSQITRLRRKAGQAGRLHKLHIDTADGDIPVSCLLTSASVHDSQVAIPLATLTASRLTSCYDLMDSAYDVPEIHQHSRALGHVPLIDINPRRNAALKQHLAQEHKRQNLIGQKPPEALRYNERSSAERVNGNFKDNHGGRTVRVRGPDKVMCHLMFGIAFIAVAQIMRQVI